MRERLRRHRERRGRLSSGAGSDRALPRFAVVAIVMAAVFAAGMAWLSRALISPRGLTLYTSQDPIHASGIIRRFERETGIRVRVVYDSEAVKTVGLANRLWAERGHPQCDVFWNNEILRTRQLALRGVFRETNGWAEFGYRSRRLVINTNLVSADQVPASLLELTNATWRGRVAVAYPMFGTTATHFLALRQHWAEAGWRAWCEALRDNDVLLLEGNSGVVRMVGQGHAVIGLTDSDDVAVGQREGLPVAALPLTPELMLIPNTVGVVRGGPNPAAGAVFYEFIRRRDVVEELVSTHALEGVAVEEVQPRTLRPEWDRLLVELEEGTAAMQSIFQR